MKCRNWSIDGTFEIEFANPSLLVPGLLEDASVGGGLGLLGLLVTVRRSGTDRALVLYMYPGRVH